MKIFLDFSGHPVAKYEPVLVKFSVTKGTEGPLRLAEFDVPRATFGDSQPPKYQKSSIFTDFVNFVQSTWTIYAQHRNKIPSQSSTKKIVDVDLH